MSIEVPLADLAAAIGARGPLVYLVTVGERGPRVVSVSVEVTGAGELRVGAGRHTSANVAARPEVALMWPADADHPKHTLLVDGTAVAAADGAEELVITPTAAILHRVRDRR